MTAPRPGRGWTREAVLDANERWVWVPEGAPRLRTDDFELVAYPPAFQVPTQVAWCRSERPAADLVEEVLATVRGWGRPDVSFWVGERTRPADLAGELRRRGAELVETVEVLALEIGDDDPFGSPAPGVTARRVHDERTLRDADLVNAEVWGHAEDPDTDVAAQVEQLAAAEADEIRVVAYVDGVPACTGGCAFVDEPPGRVARLWGGATRPAYRNRGAYRATLQERVRLARERGATLALVRGITTTSAPILRRVGFVPHGRQDRYRLMLGSG